MRAKIGTVMIETVAISHMESARPMESPLVSIANAPQSAIGSITPSAVARMARFCRWERPSKALPKRIIKREAVDVSPPNLARISLPGLGARRPGRVLSVLSTPLIPHDVASLATTLSLLHALWSVLRIGGTSAGRGTRNTSSSKRSSRLMPWVKDFITNDQRATGMQDRAALRDLLR